MYQRVQNLQQCDKTVKEYTQEFHQLRSNLVETENQEVIHYINGLRLVIQDQVSLQRPYKVNDAYQLALKVETQFYQGSSKKSGLERSSATTSKTNNINQGGQRTAPTRTGGKTVQTYNYAQGNFCDEVL